MESGWNLVLDLLIALCAALGLGLLMEKLRVNAVIGYLAAGALVGPGGFGLIGEGRDVSMIAEIGVALLLFTIGLEFSWQRLVRRPKSLAGALVSIVVTLAVTFAVCLAFGLGAAAAYTVAAAVSLSSTAVVLRILRERNQLDTTHGRTVLRILLLQDLALVPILLSISLMTSPSTSVWREVGWVVGASILLSLGLVVFSGVIVPRVLDERAIAKNRELPILLAVMTCVGATFVAHQLGLSPALGAFLAGMLLAENKYSHQIRADVAPLKTLFVTIFFVSIGLTADLGWAARNLHIVLGVAVATMLLKTLATYFSLRPFVPGAIECLASALAVAQIGEFSFVILAAGHSAGTLPTPVFFTMISASLVTLVLTPALTGRSMEIGRSIAKRLFPARKLAAVEREARSNPLTGHVVLIGYGESGQSAALSMEDRDWRLLVVDVDSALVGKAQGEGHLGLVGDATQMEVLEAAAIDEASAVVVTVPAYETAKTIISQVKVVSPKVPVVARSRYHLNCAALDMAGADVVLDEEAMVGQSVELALDDLLVVSSAPAAQES